MRKFLTISLLFFTIWASAQNNQAVSMSAVLAYNARFNPADLRQAEILKNLKPSYLVKNLKTDNEKFVFWINVYNSNMLIQLRDTIYEGDYKNFYKIKNVKIAGKDFSLFDIEHEFIWGGIKMKAMGFKKSKISKDTLWEKLRPQIIDSRAIFCMYRGLYGYPPFQIIETADLNQAYLNANKYVINEEGSLKIVFDWVKTYSKFIKLDLNQQIIPLTGIEFINTPLAVFINNFYPKYEGVKFKEEEKNPWLK